MAKLKSIPRRESAGPGVARELEIDLPRLNSGFLRRRGLIMGKSRAAATTKMTFRMVDMRVKSPARPLDAWNRPINRSGRPLVR